MDGLPYFLSITDTAGQEEYRGLWTASTMGSDAFLLVYDITNPSSLETLDYFMDMINMEADQRVEDNQRLRKELGPKATGAVGLPPPVKIVVGNKCDLKDGRAISARDGLEYARRHGCGFMETSAREMVNIEETFALLVRRVVDARRLHDQGTVPRPPPSRAGQSVHTTALPPMTDARTAHPRQAWYRRSRFLRFGSGRKLAQSPEPPETNTKHGAGEEEEEELEPRGCLLRRLCCCGLC